MPYSNREKQLEAQRRYYRENKERQAQRQRDRRNLKKKYIQDAKTDVPCADCNIIYPFYVMHFDHIKGTKVTNLNKMPRDYNMEQIIAEMAKCEVVCANCHSHRTWMRSAGTVKSKNLGAMV